MFGILLVFSFCLKAIHSSGEFVILTTPKGISFKGNDVLSSQYVGDVLNAAVGNAVSDDAKWDGMYVTDPFSLAKNVVAVHLDGTNNLAVNTDAKVFEMEGIYAENALDLMREDLETSADTSICDINFNEFEEGVAAYRACFGDIAVPVSKTTYLNPALHTADKQFLQSINYINIASEKLATVLKTRNFLIFRLSLEPISKTHGKKSEAVLEASKLIAAAVSKLNAAAQQNANDDVLVVTITNKSSGGRTKRETDESTYKLAESYSADYPVIFNIILWFMVVFGFSLLAICYAIGTMDPGRDSIIYRMTSTRMKKDN